MEYIVYTEGMERSDLTALLTGAWSGSGNSIPKGNAESQAFFMAMVFFSSKTKAGLVVARQSLVLVQDNQRAHIHSK